MAKKQRKGRPTRKGLPWFAWLLIALGIAGIVVFVRLYVVGQPSPDNVGGLKAVIVDQLSSVKENEQFITNVTGELEGYGFEVALYQGDNITVEFYRQLPTHGYKLIIFRAHSGLLAENEQVKDRTVLFTNEEYRQFSHYDDQLHGRLVIASVGGDNPMVFGIPPKFIKESMPRKFDDSVVIMMGCSGLFMRDLAEAFIAEGASVYLGWNGSVELDYVDEATAYLVTQLCSANMTVKEAVASTRDVIGPDPEHKAGLEYYPSGSSDKKLEDLIK